jgi:hypothetical protein
VAFTFLHGSSFMKVLRLITSDDGATHEILGWHRAGRVIVVIRVKITVGVIVMTLTGGRPKPHWTARDGPAVGNDVVAHGQQPWAAAQAITLSRYEAGEDFRYMRITVARCAELLAPASPRLHRVSVPPVILFNVTHAGIMPGCAAAGPACQVIAMLSWSDLA